MIIRSHRELKKKPSIDRYDCSKVISRLKIHPSLLEEYKEPKEFNFITRKSSELKVSSINKSMENNDKKQRRSSILLTPLKSSSVSKKLSTRTELSERKESRSDRKLLIIKNDSSYYQKDKNLKDLLFYYEKNENQVKFNKITNAFSENHSMDEENLDIEEQFYQQVRVLQRFKELSEIIN